MRTVSPTRDVIVLESSPAPKPTTNPYNVMLLESMRATPGLQVRTFTWATALFGRYDVFHAHWPEILVSGRTPFRMLIRQLLMVAFLLRLGLTRTPIVRTQHNLARPSGISWRENALLAWFEAWTSYWIVINEVTPLPPGRPHSVILHGHYRDWYARYPQPPKIPGRFSYFGRVRRYKGLEALVSAFRELQGDYSLHIAGVPSSDDLVQSLRTAAGDDPRITFDFRFLPDAELVNVAAEGELIVLPYPEMHNSGSVLAALSLGRPVLVPDNEVNDRLRAEVGNAWVLTFKGDLTAADLVAGLAAARSIPAGARPDLSRREWDACGHAHLAAFRAALEGAGRRVGRTA